jgi:hypothetical protein
MSGGGPIYQDTPARNARKTVDVVVNLNVNARDKTKPQCEHGNNKGECLVCWKFEHGEQE